MGIVVPVIQELKSLNKKTDKFATSFGFPIPRGYCDRI
jgi:hypothetical protein